MGHRIYLLLGLNLLSILVESLGLLLFIPFFQTLQIGGDRADGISRLFFDSFNQLGIELTLSKALILLVAAFSCKAVVVFFILAYRQYLSSLMRFNIRQELLEKMSTLDYRYALSKGVGFFGNLAVSETERAIQSMHSFCRCVSSLMTASIFIATALLVHPQLSAVILFAGVLNTLMLRSITILARHSSREVSRLNHRLNGLLIELLQSLKYLKSTGQCGRLQKLIHETNRNTAHLERRRNLASSAYEAVREPILVLSISAVIYYYVAIVGQPVALILVPILFFYRCMLEANFVQLNWQAACDDSGGLDCLFSAAQDFEGHREPEVSKVPVCFDHAIDLRNVCFSHGKTLVLKDVSLTIRKNSSFAFIGVSGSGKTTLVDLLTGVLKAKTGEVLVDGVNLNHLDAESFRSRIGYVAQDPIIFSDTVANNISMQLDAPADPETTARIRQAAALSNADEFIRQLPEGYQTRLGEKGVQLSGGQKQRLAIARELFREPEILILDEPTSALDFESEHFIQQSIQTLHGKITLVLVSHRLASARDIDQIYVLEKGKIVEHGTFEELFHRAGTRFRELCDFQQFPIERPRQRAV